MNKLDFAYYLTNYFSSFLPGQKGLSQNSILSYRDTFVLFLRFCQDCKGIRVEKLTFRDINRHMVEDFLIWLETENNSSISTRNQRLAALRSFFRYVQIEEPGCLMLCQSIISIEAKRQPHTIVNYLSSNSIKSLLAQPNTRTHEGRRDLALLSVLYDSAARVQEVCDIKVGDVRLNDPAIIQLTGKRNKTRCVPLSSSVVVILRHYLSENALESIQSKDKYLFVNRSFQPLTRSGVRYILEKYAAQARQITPECIPSTVNPHCLRHSKAMHLLQAGTNLIYIRDFLGHDDIKTTQIYARADPEMKRKALLSGFSQDIPKEMPSWKDNPNLLSRLIALGKSK